MMTEKVAKLVFSSLMFKARQGPLTVAQKKQLTEARQALRMSRRSVMNAPTLTMRQAVRILMSQRPHMTEAEARLFIREHALKQGTITDSGLTDALRAYDSLKGIKGVHYRNPRKLRRGTVLARGVRLHLKGNENPNKPVLIYGRILRIEAVKTQAHRCDAKCKKAGHRYFHDFKPGAKIYGMPDHTLVIR